MNLFHEINLTETDRYILSILDNKLTIKEILSISTLGELQTMKTLCALISVRMLEIKEKEGIEDKGVIEIIKEPYQDVDSAFLEKVEDLYKKYKSIDYYSILEVGSKASTDNIRRAYYEAAKEFHPNRHFSQSSETLRRKLNEIFSYITEAFKTLSDPKLREQYDRTLKVTSPEKTSSKEQARVRFKEGKIAFNKGLYSNAVEMFGQAVYLDNSISDYHFYLGLARKNIMKLKSQ